MTLHPMARRLNTKDITIMSHVASVTVTGDKISKLPGSSVDQPGTIHLNFEVKGKKDEPCVLSGAEEIGLILEPSDALELGLLLLEMELEQQSPEQLAAIKARLSPLFA